MSLTNKEKLKVLSEIERKGHSDKIDYSEALESIERFMDGEEDTEMEILNEPLDGYKKFLMYRMENNPQTGPVFIRMFNDGTMEPVDPDTFHKEKYLNYLPKEQKAKLYKYVGGREDASQVQAPPPIQPPRPMNGSAQPPPPPPISPS